MYNSLKAKMVKRGQFIYVIDDARFRFSRTLFALFYYMKENRQCVIHIFANSINRVFLGFLDYKW